MYEERQALQARQVLGISPRRLMSARRRPSPGRMADGRNAHAHFMRQVDRFLIALRKAGRRAILIVDADCGNGRRLIDVAARARTLGFVAIEARGFDASPRQIAEAIDAAEAHGDSITFNFAVREEASSLSLDDSGDEQADLMLSNARRPASELADALDRDGILIRHG